MPQQAITWQAMTAHNTSAVPRPHGTSENTGISGMLLYIYCSVNIVNVKQDIPNEEIPSRHKPTRMIHAYSILDLTRPCITFV